MSKKLRSLLVGIDHYPTPYSLSGCETDVHKVSAYLNELSKAEQYDSVLSPKLLCNSDATKTAIISELKEQLLELEDGDTFVFYFSGHGAEEKSEDRFLDDHNGFLQGVVCYHTDQTTENYLLADKEIRYLLNLCKAKAHIVAIFDSCHSGDISRGEMLSNTIKRMAVKHPPRDYTDFVFHTEAPEKDFKNTPFTAIFPDANYIVISACQSNQSAWEGREGGVFTHELIAALEATKGVINYSDLVQRIENTIRLTTIERQSPTITVHGDRNFNQLTSWLRLAGDRLTSSQSYIQLNKKLGWIFNKGSLDGIETGDVLEFELENKDKKTIKIESVYLIDSVVQDPMLLGIQLNPEHTYLTTAPIKINKPLLSINNLDNDRETTEQLSKLIENNDSVVLSKPGTNSDYHVTVFNELVYFSFPNKPFQPLNRQFNLLAYEPASDIHEDALVQYLESSLPILTKWFHYQKLDINQGFLEIPIKVELQKTNQSSWTDVTNGQIQLQPKPRHPVKKQLYSPFEIKITNVSNETLYITVLALITSKHEISAYPFEENTVLLEPGKDKTFENVIMLDPYQEVYNWEKESVIFKFIVNNSTEINTRIPGMTQRGFEEPLTHLNLMGTRGGGALSDFDAPEKNAVFTSEVILENTECNIVSGDLRTRWDWYQENELLLPFIEQLYFEVDQHQLTNEANLVAQSAEVNAKGGFKMFLGNSIDYARRNRRFRRLRKRYPEKRVIVAEGDSWFLYPILVKDTIDYIMDDWPVKSLAWAGDTLENYKKSGDLLKAVKKYEPKFVLISGGGNDIIGSEIQGLLKDNVQDAVDVKDYLNDKFEPRIKTLEGYYTYFFDKISAYPHVEKILVHGYDYIRSDHAKIVTKNGWLNKYLEKKGITDYEVRARLIIYLIDRFNSTLEDLTKKYPKAIYLNMRGIVDKDQWFDEIHPNDEGYKKVAAKFLNEIT